MMRLPDPSLPWPIDYQAGVVPIATDEQGPGGGCALAAYLCPAGKWTCGWGETDGVTPSTRWTEAYADQRLCDGLTERVNLVKAACTIEPTPNQLAALVSFAYNYGAWRSSSALKAHNRGDAQACANAMHLVDEFTDPVTKKRVVSRGLQARRAREAALYLKPTEGAHAMPQEVAPEPHIAASPTVQTSTAAAGVGVLALVSQAGDAIGPVNSTVTAVKGFAVDTLGIPKDYFLPALLIVIGLVVLWRRFGQRAQGVA